MTHGGARNGHANNSIYYLLRCNTFRETALNLRNVYYSRYGDLTWPCNTILLCLLHLSFLLVHSSALFGQ
jgi:hypothetical protein